MELIAVSNKIIEFLRLLHICVEMEHTTSLVTNRELMEENHTEVNKIKFIFQGDSLSPLTL
jgi:hypothetical protein